MTHAITLSQLPTLSIGFIDKDQPSLSLALSASRTSRASRPGGPAPPVPIAPVRPTCLVRILSHLRPSRRLPAFVPVGQSSQLAWLIRAMRGFGGT